MSLVDQLTERQQAVFEFIRDRISERGYGPTVREIGAHFDISSPNGVMCHLRALEKKGLLQRVRKQDRAVARRSNWPLRSWPNTKAYRLLERLRPV